VQEGLCKEAQQVCEAEAQGEESEASPPQPDGKPMRTKQIAALRIALVSLGLFGVSSTASVAFTSSASAATPGVAWAVHSVSQPTNFVLSDNEKCETIEEAERSCDQYTLAVANVGSKDSNGEITVTDTLPEGIKTAGTPTDSGTANGESVWSCTTEAGTKDNSVVVCTSNTPVPALGQANAIFVPAKIEPSAHGTAINEITVSGGGGPISSTSSQTPISPLKPLFGVLGFSGFALDASGALEAQADGHPAAFTTTFDFPSANAAFGKIDALPVESARRIVVDLPAGFVGNPQAAPACPLSTLVIAPKTQHSAPCEPATQIGTLGLIEPPVTQPGAEVNLPIFNIVPEHGYPAEFGVFDPLLKRAVLMYARIRTGSDYGVRVISGPIPRALPINGISATFFGEPATKDKSGNSPLAFFTNPSSCSPTGGSFEMMIHVDSWQRPGSFNADGTPNFNDPNWKTSEQPALLPAVKNCSALQFSPELEVASDKSQVDEPSGYKINLRVPQNEDPNGLATPPLKDAVVTLPAGVTISPAAADGLLGCQETGSDGIELKSAAQGHCPFASTVGSVKVVTPLLKEPLEGNVYVAQPACGGSAQPACTEEAAETGGIFALYLEVGSENSGVHIKLKGKVEVGGNGQHNGLALGQIRTTFEDTPQQPFSELKLHLNDGPRAPLANPQTCGQFTTTSDLIPWSSPATPDATPISSFEVTGCEGFPFKPSFNAGTVNPAAGGFSPFTLTFSRHDREQNLSGITVHMPPGLLGSIAGIPQCPEAQANAGTCSAASRIGSVTAAAGAGSHPFWQSGTAYLTGPYGGAPFGLSVAVPAVAGPYNLGNIIVRARIFVDPDTAQLTVVSNPLPQSVDGVPLRVQTVNVTTDRPEFTFNSTSCGQLQIAATIAGLQGASANVASQYAVTGCRNLPFKPVFTASTSGKTSKLDGASLNVKIGYTTGQANLRRVDLSLPIAMPSRLTTLNKACTEAQFNANPAGCPSASDVATAIAHTPLLNVPVAGPVYLVSHGGAAFPDVEMILQGEGVELIVDGKTQIKKGITFSHFDTIPDAPISSFEFHSPQGPFSLFAANGNLCKPVKTLMVKKRITARRHGKLVKVTHNVSQQVPEPLVMPTTLTAQNGAVIKQNTKIAVTGCPKPKQAKKHKQTTKKKGRK
jgi:uncharacterized repeat protein (TIGR01451 family)